MQFIGYFAWWVTYLVCLVSHQIRPPGVWQREEMYDAVYWVLCLVCDLPGLLGFSPENAHQGCGSVRRCAMQFIGCFAWCAGFPAIYAHKVQKEAYVGVYTFTVSATVVKL